MLPTQTDLDPILKHWNKFCVWRNRSKPTHPFSSRSISWHQGITSLLPALMSMLWRHGRLFTAFPLLTRGRCHVTRTGHWLISERPYRVIKLKSLATWILFPKNHSLHHFTGNVGENGEPLSVFQDFMGVKTIWKPSKVNISDDSLNRERARDRGTERGHWGGMEGGNKGVAVSHLSKVMTSIRGVYDWEEGQRDLLVCWLSSMKSGNTPGATYW